MFEKGEAEPLAKWRMGRCGRTGGGGGRGVDDKTLTRFTFRSNAWNGLRFGWEIAKPLLFKRPPVSDRTRFPSTLT